MRGAKGMSLKGQEVHLHKEGGVLGRATSRGGTNEEELGGGQCGEG